MGNLDCSSDFLIRLYNRDEYLDNKSTLLLYKGIPTTYSQYKSTSNAKKVSSRGGSGVKPIKKMK